MPLRFIKCWNVITQQCSWMAERRWGRPFRNCVLPGNCQRFAPNLSLTGAIEIWNVENVVGMDHPFHLHGYQFQVLDRNGVPEPERRWKDTVNVPKHETVRIIVHFDAHPGKWMFHCHILDHEDHGMMGILEIK